MENSSGALTATGLLQVALIVLKLIGKISWSWFWVLSPTWIGIVLFVILMIILVLISNN